MIGSLRGEVLERWARRHRADRRRRASATRSSCRRARSASWSRRPPAFLYVHHHIREDDQTLYGFLTRDERSTFKTLIATHGVGPALAMAILATYPPAALVDVVANGDVGALKAVPGVGPKTAQRLLVELRDRLSVPVLDGDVGAGRRRRARRPSAPCARRWPGSATAPTRSATPSASCPATATRRRCCATPSSCSGPRVRDEFLDPGVNDDVEDAVEAGLRPRRLDEFVGQRELKEHLGIVLEAARRRQQAVDHLLFAGPPGLGKTTLATIVAAEMDVQLHITSGPALERAGDLAAILTKLGEHDVLFVDEIHRLSRAVEEILYPAMEDFQLDIVVGKGPAASSIRLTLPPFTLVGATTRTGMITGPLRDRFGLVARLDYYDADRAAGDRRARRRDPRRAASTTTGRGRSPAAPGARRGSPTACCAGCATSPRCAATARIDAATAERGLTVFGVDELGLDKVDRAILGALCEQFGGGPVGLSTLAIAVGEQTETVEDVYEPFLIQQGLIARTPRGRVAMPAAFEHLGLRPPEAASTEPPRPVRLNAAGSLRRR